MPWRASWARDSGSSRFSSISAITLSSLGWLMPKRLRNAMRWVSFLVADPLVDELLGHRGRQLAAMVVADQRQHQVERGDPAGTSHALAVDLEQLRRDVELREGFLEAGQVLPMDGAAIAVEQSGVGQDIAAGGDRAQPVALPSELAQPAEHLPVVVGLGRQAGDHEQSLQTLRLGHGAVRQNLDPAGGFDGLTVARNDVPGVERTGRKTIGRTQRLDRRGEAHQGEIPDQEKTEHLLSFVRISPVHRGRPRSLLLRVAPSGPACATGPIGQAASPGEQPASLACVTLFICPNNSFHRPWGGQPRPASRPEFGTA